MRPTITVRLSPHRTHPLWVYALRGLFAGLLMAGIYGVVVL